MAERKSILIRGLIAGAIAATVLAVWFLAVDAIQGRPLYTPAFVATALLGRDTVLIDAATIAGYTLFHYASFAIVGVLVSWLLSKIDAVPSFLLGLVLGFLLFDVVFYAGIVVTGVNVVQRLGWPVVLAGNLLAGIVLMAYLQIAGPARAMTWWEGLAQNRVLREGTIAGLIGAIVVALWFLIFDALADRVFFTPAALGSALLLGATSIAEVRLTPGTVATYTLIHFTAFVAIGIVAAALVKQAEERPPFLLGLILLLVTFEVQFLGILAIFATWILDTLGWWNILVGNLLAAVAIGAYLWIEHPRLRKAFRDLGGETVERPR